MKRKIPFFLALGAGAALISVWNRRLREEKARLWKRQVQNRPRTAFITGASSGIGAVFARALARQGYNLVLLARRQDRLRSLAEEIQRENPVQAEVLVADLSDPADLERAAARVAEIPDLDILVNNAGFGVGGLFYQNGVKQEMDMIRVHVLASARLMRAALPGMVARQRGGIINVSSMAGFMPMPGNASYGSTKSYLNFLSKSLNIELSGTGVRVQALCPGFTYSEFHDVMQVDRSTIPSFLWMQAEDVVSESLQGLWEGRVIVIPGTINRLMALFLAFPMLEPLINFAQQLPLFQRWKGV